MRPWQENTTWKRKLFFLISLVLVLVFVIFFPFPYVIEMPGPTYNVLGAVDREGNSLKRDDKTGTPLINFEKGTKVYQGKGELRMVTVGLLGGPGRHVSLAELAWAYWHKDAEIVPEDQIFPKGATEKQVKQFSQAQMTNSQDTAETAAYLYLGEKLAVTSKVAEPFKDTPFKKGDILVSLTNQNGTFQLDQAPVLHQQMRLTPPGSKISVVVKRDGKEQTLSVTTKKTKDPYRSGSLLGIYLDEKVKLPQKAQFPLKDVGGPSAGMIFAVGIIDLLTPGDLTGGKAIAGTGTIDALGNVGQISGLSQKIAGATEDGAKYFLFPKQNCPDFAKIKDQNLGVKAYPVGKLDEAVEAVKAIADGKEPAVTQCSADDLVAKK